MLTWCWYWSWPVRYIALVIWSGRYKINMMVNGLIKKQNKSKKYIYF